MAHEALDPAFRRLIDADAPVREIGSGFQFTEGPIWHPRDAHLLFSDMPGDVRRRWDGRRIAEAARPSNMGNGMTYDAALNLIVCEHATSSVARLAPNGAREVLASHFEGRELNSPNDVAVKSDGSIWFTDPTFGRMAGFGVERPLEMGFQGVYRIPPGGGDLELVVDRYTFGQPNGLCFSPDESLLYVNDTTQTNIRVYRVGAARRLDSGRVFASGIVEQGVPGVPDGMKCDERGDVWVTAPGGLWVYAPDGRLIGKVAVPKLVANFHWGGEDWRTLFCCATSSVYAIPVTVGPRREPFMSAEGQRAAPAREAVGLSLDPAATALIVQDMQNDVISEGGAFAESGAPAHARQQDVIANARRLIAACRAAQIPVIYVNFVCEPGHPAMLQNAPLFEGLVEANALVRGSWGAAVADALTPQPGDLIVEKMTMSAWESGRLATYLAGLGATTLINTGAWTNMSVEHTARTGADKGFVVVVPEDACSSMNADWHRASVDYAMGNVALVASVNDVISALK